MPILHFEARKKVKGADGKITEKPSAAELQRRGPILPVTVTIEQNMGKGLMNKGSFAPKNKDGFALIDTGASNTCIDEQAAQELGLPVIGVGAMVSASHEKSSCNIYPVLISTPVARFNAPRAMGAALASQGLLALIGRDILRSCNLFYDGTSGQFFLSI